jgi:hypothetical protein
MLAISNPYLKLGIALSIAAGLALSVGCSLEKKGTAVENTPPQVFFANVPNDSSFLSANPIVAWYGTDVDGYIIEFQYIVVKDSVVTARGLTAEQMKDNFPTDLTDWIAVEGTRDTVQLYASIDDTIYTKQYIFLRAMDDDEDLSAIKYRTLSRNNHAPETALNLVVSYERYDAQGIPVLYCLPERSDYFAGLRFEWVGSDTMDYPGDQPAFEYHWALYGPDTSANVDTSAVGVYTNEGERYESYDSTRATIWVYDQAVYLAGLRTGYYLFMARSRDDAFVPDPNPALDTVHVVEPLFISDPDSATDIAFLDISRYDQHATFKVGQETVADSLRRFFYRSFAAAGVDSATQIAFYSDSSGSETRDPIPFQEIFDHKLVIVAAEGYRFAITLRTCEELRWYLEAGGMVWITGRQCFKYHNTSPLWYFDETWDSDILASDYLDMETSWFSGWIPSPLFQDQEFIGASGYASGFPDLSIDSLQVARIYYGRDWDTTKLPGVERMARGDSSETVYKFISGDPELSEFHGWPVATRRQGGNFKCSYFGFPLHYIKQEQANEMMSLMLDWFLSETTSNYGGYIPQVYHFGRARYIGHP